MAGYVRLVFSVDRAHGTDHAVDEYRHFRQGPVALGAFQDQQDFLRSPHGEGGDQHAASPGDHLANLRQQPFLGRLAVLVKALAVGRLADHQVRLEIGTAKCGHGVLGRDAVVAREQHRARRRLQQDHGGPEDVRCRQPADFDVLDANRLMVLHRHEGGQELVDLTLAVQGQFALPFGAVHQSQGVLQQDRHQVDRRRRGQHRRPAAGFRDHRQAAGMVHVRMGHQHRVYGRLGQRRQVRKGARPGVTNAAVHDQRRVAHPDQRAGGADRRAAPRETIFRSTYDYSWNLENQRKPGTGVLPMQCVQYTGQRHGLRNGTKHSMGMGAGLEPTDVAVAE